MSDNSSLSDDISISSNCPAQEENLDIDSSIIQIWELKHPDLDAAQRKKIRSKKLNSRHGKKVADSLWQVTQNWMLEKFGEEMLCTQVAGRFPHFIMEEDSLFGQQFQIYESPGRKGHSFSLQIYYQKTANGWKSQTVDHWPDCRKNPADCQFKIDRRKAKKIAAENGIEETEHNSVSIRGMGHKQPFYYRIHKHKVAGECLDSIDSFD